MTTVNDEIRPEDGGNILPTSRHLSAGECAAYLGLWDAGAELTEMVKSTDCRTREPDWVEFAKVCRTYDETLHKVRNSSAKGNKTAFKQHLRAAATLIVFGNFKELEVCGVPPSVVQELLKYQRTAQWIREILDK